MKLTKLQQRTVGPIASLCGGMTITETATCVELGVTCEGQALSITYYPGGVMTTGGVTSPVPRIIVQRLSEMTSDLRYYALTSQKQNAG